jgi:hypothetical protein
MQMSEAAGELEGGGCCYSGNRFPAEIINHAIRLYLSASL